MDTPQTNVPEYTVSEISGAVKRTLESAFGRVRVRGEITELKRYASGHTYLCLKDEGGKMRAIVWKSGYGRLGLKPENGLEVIATGRISAYGDRSEYQLLIDRLEYAGIGAMLARTEALRVALAAEGLFDAERKRPLPMLPEVVGVITSPAGAVLHDIRTTIARRCPRRIVLWPVPVQGEGAAARIAAAIRGFSALPAGGTVPRPDVLIVARGGGSLEDLMAFNDEAVVRAAAACSMPLISAVGHETDTTLIDFASDRRAPTPTAAAELAVPSRIALLATLAQQQARLVSALHRAIQTQRLRLGRASARLPDLPAIVGHARQRLDDRAHRLGLALPHLLAHRRNALAHASQRLPDLPALVAAARHRLDDRGHRLVLALPHLIERRRNALARAARGLPDPAAILRAAELALAERSRRLDQAPARLLDTRRAALALQSAHLRGALRHVLQDRQHAAGRLLPRLNLAPLQAMLRERRARLEGLAARLDSVSHNAVLARGYALVQDPTGHTLTSAKIKPGAKLVIHFADGTTDATVDRGKQGSLPL